ncbi:MAG: BlaI/MecI/CopY family transcriptional regulator [Gemmatimonadaceae bacterium]
MDGILGERELDIMAALWREGPGTVAEVQARLPASLAYNTVLTILRNLEGKGFVGHTAEGRLFRYAPAVTEQSVRKSALSRLVDKLFRGSRIQAVAHLVDDEQLSAAELKGLYELLDARLSAPRGRRGTKPAPSLSHKTTPRSRRRK